MKTLIERLRRRADDLRRVAALNCEAGDKFPQEILDLVSAAKEIEAFQCETARLNKEWATTIKRTQDLREENARLQGQANRMSRQIEKLMAENRDLRREIR